MSSGAHANNAKRTAVVGTHVVEGYAAGTRVQVTTPERTTLQEGGDGHSLFRTTARRSMVVSFVLLPSSESNDVMSALFLAGLPIPVQVRDGNGRTLASSPRGMITKMADFGFGDADETISWAIVCADATVFVGGMPAAATNPDA